MAIKLEHELFGPGDVPASGASNASRGLGRREQMPVWGVGNPVAVAMSGLQEQVSAFADTWDGVQVDSFLERTRQNFYKDYLDPENGLFNTNKSGGAEGLYQGYVDRARDIVDRQMPEELSARQQRMANKPLSVLFQDQGLKVADFETKQLMAYQVERIENNLSSAVDSLAKYGINDLDAVGGAFTSIQNAYEALGKIQGWDEETIVRKIREEFGAAVIKGATATALNDPTMAYDILNAYSDIIPPAMYEAALRGVVDQFSKDAKEQVFHALYVGGPTAAREKVLELSKVGQAAGWAGDHMDFVMSRESGRRPAAVNEMDRDKAGNPGMSFGLFQIRQADGKGSKNMTEFAAFLNSTDHRAASQAVTDLLALPREQRKAEWERLVKEGIITNGMQSQYITDKMINPGINMLATGVRDLVENDTAAMNAFASTVVQHGYPAAARMFNSSWKNASLDNFKFYGLLYEERQSLGMPASRAQAELSEIRGMLGSDGYHRRQELGLGYRDSTVLLKQIESYERQNAWYAKEVRNLVMPAAFARYYQTGDTSSIDELRVMVEELGDPKLKMEFGIQERVALKLHPWMMDNLDKDFETQIAGANAIIQDMLEKEPYALDNAHLLNKIKTDTEKFYREQMKLAIADPVGQAAVVRAQMLEERAQNGVPLPVEVSEPLSAEQLLGEQGINYANQVRETRENMRIQQQWFGKDPTYIPKVLSTNTVKTVKELLANDSVDPDRKVQTLINLALSRGEYWEFAASELGLDGGAVVAINSWLASGGANNTEVREMLMAALTPDAQFGGAAKIQEFYGDAQSNPLVEYLNEAVSVLSLGSIQAKWAPEVEKTMAKLYLSGRGDVADRIAASYDFYSNKRSAIFSAVGGRPAANVIFQIPRSTGLDATEAGDAMTWYINGDDFAKTLPEDLLKTISYTTPPDVIMTGTEWSLGAELLVVPGTSETVLRHIGLEGVRHGGIWLSANNGTSAVLFLNGEMARNPRTGELIYVDLEPIIKQYRDFRRPTEEAVKSGLANMNFNVF